MGKLLSPASKPSKRLAYLGIAINKFGTHITILHRKNHTDRVLALHLGWDHVLKDEPLEDLGEADYFWAHLSIPLRRAKTVAHFVGLIKQRNPNGIPYAFGDPIERFSADGTFIQDEKKVGLTCASFVVSVLERAGIHLIDRSTWHRLCDDHAFFGWVIRALKGEIPNFPAAERADHPDVLRRQVEAGAFRYSPMQIAGAALCKKIPVSFLQADRQAVKVRGTLPESAKSLYYLYF